jgi:hypothetical protein
MSDLNQDIQTYDMMERYAKGESLSDLAAECGLEEANLRKRMRNYDPAKYKEAKGDAAQARIDFRHAENKQILSLNRVNLLSELESETSEISVGDMCKIEKTFGDRVALTEGEATERQEHVGKVLQIVKFTEVQGDDTEQTIS